MRNLCPNEETTRDQSGYFAVSPDLQSINELIGMTDIDPTAKLY